MKPQLPNDLLWAEDGHASDVVLTAIADGEFDIVPSNAREHVDDCATCTKQIGHLALLSLQTGRVFAVFSPRESVRLPLGMILTGSVFAVLGLLPTLLDRPIHTLGEASSTWTTLRSASTALFKALSHATVVPGISVSLACSALLLLVSLTFTRTLRNR